MFNATLLNVIDGDTISVIVQLPLDVYKVETVRLLDIDTPERNTPEGKAATLYLQQLLCGNKQVLIDIGNNSNKAKRDRYGRLLAHIYTLIGDKHITVSSHLLENGHAVKYVKK